MTRMGMVALVFTFVLGGLCATVLARGGARAAAGPRRWEQFCSYRTAGGTGSAQNMLKSANEDMLSYGKQGWELAAAASSGSIFAYCFKRAAE